MAILTAPTMRVPQSARSPVSDQQNGFAGGQNPMAGTALAPLDQCASMSNMRLVRNQELAKRPGLRLMGTMAANQRMFPSTLNVSNRILSLDFDTGNAHASKQTFQSTGTPTLTSTNLSDTSVAYFTGTHAAQFRDGTGDTLYVPTYVNANTSAATGMIKWDGTTLTEGVAAGKITGLSQLWVYNQRLFGCVGVPVGVGTGGFSQVLYWSGLNNGDTMADTANGGGFAAIRTFGGQNILGGFALGNSNFILHQNAISMFRGTTFDDINIAAGAEGMTPNVGYPMAWKVVGEIGYLLTDQGLFIATANGINAAHTPDYPDPIRTFLATTTDTIGPVSFPMWFVLENPRRKEIWCVISTVSGGGTKTSRVFIYHTDLRRFTGSGVFGIVVTDAHTAIDNGGLYPQMLFVSGSDGKVYGCDFLYDSSQVYQDNGSSYTSSVQLRRMFSAEAPSDQKAWRSLAVQMGSGAGDTPASAGSTTGGKVNYTTTIGGAVSDTTNLLAQETNHIQLSGQGNAIDITVSDGGTSSTGWSVMRADANGYAYGRRGG